MKIYWPNIKIVSTLITYDKIRNFNHETNVFTLILKFLKRKLIAQLTYKIMSALRLKNAIYLIKLNQFKSDTPSIKTIYKITYTYVTKTQPWYKYGSKKKIK